MSPARFVVHEAAPASTAALPHVGASYHLAPAALSLVRNRHRHGGRLRRAAGEKAKASESCVWWGDGSAIDSYADVLGALKRWAEVEPLRREVLASRLRTLGVHDPSTREVGQR